MVRNIVRGIEHAQGTDGNVSSNEVYIYIFDATPMFIVVALFAVFQAGRLRRTVRNLTGGSLEEAKGGDMEESQTEGLVSKYSPAKPKYTRPYEQPEMYSR